jgi:FeS assembly SUF system protein
MDDSTLNEPATPAADGPLEPEGADAVLRSTVITALKTCYDPEIPVDIYELGLIYEVEVRDESTVYVKMTLTSPMCPVAEILPVEVEEKVRTVDGVSDVNLDLVWDPPWDVDMMSEAARLELNF